MNFTAIDFETATGKRSSACAVGIVTVEGGAVTDRFSCLIQPPGNAYNGFNIGVHGIHPHQTQREPTFAGVYSKLRARLRGRTLVAHNEVFDRSVLKRTMEHYGLDYAELGLANRWECTMRIYRAKGFVPYRLDACCRQLNIPLDHHDALSDALACAELYLRR